MFETREIVWKLIRKIIQLVLLINFLLQFSLSKANASYNLTIELGVAIDMIIFEGDVEVELINVDTSKYTITLDRPNVLVSSRITFLSTNWNFN